jgi:hypothetical protein
MEHPTTQINKEMSIRYRERWEEKEEIVVTYEEQRDVILKSQWPIL